jgi:nucleoside-diphosphate-sugar epimerase
MALAFSTEKFAPAEVFFAAEKTVETWPATMLSLAKALDVEGRELRIPIGLIRFLSRITGPFGRLSGASVALNEDKAKEIAVEYWTCSSEKLNSRIGFKPLWRLDDGFRQTAEWYRGRGWL